MKKPILYLFLLIFFFKSSLLAYSTNPKEFINELVNDAMSKLSNKDLTLVEKEDYIRNVNNLRKVRNLRNVKRKEENHLKRKDVKLRKIKLRNEQEKYLKNKSK